VYNCQQTTSRNKHQQPFAAMNHSIQAQAEAWSKAYATEDRSNILVLQTSDLPECLNIVRDYAKFGQVE
jgi:hypothetical protein